MSGQLTVRAKNGGPPRDAAAFQRGPTLKAGLAGTAVHPEGVLKSPGVAPRRTVVPDGTAARVNGFDAHGKVWGLESFGFSAPYKVLDQKLGFTADNVYKQVKAML